MIISLKPSGQTERLQVRAEVRTSYPLPTKIILENGDVLDLHSWRSRGCRVLQAARDEVRALRRMGLL